MTEIPVTTMWWLTVITYGVTAVLCLIAAVRTPIKRGFWGGLALGMLLLGINKQQDLTGILTKLMRGAAWQEQWYFSRQPVQLTLIVIAALLFGGLFFWLARKAKPASRWQSLALLGIVFLAGFALVRAVSLHAVDAFLYRRIGGIQPNWIVELGGITLVALPAIRQLFIQPKQKEFA
ncbi:MAG: hypothetical protein H6667_15625 [Ardenticatenaceae bacterium]|nr:hypothetical protein [Ardenticatenaceae bacterium]